MNEIIECESKEELRHITEEDGLRVLAANPHFESVTYRVKDTKYNKTIFRMDYDEEEISEYED